MTQNRPPFPLIEMRIEPILKANLQRLLPLLEELSRTEPGFSYTVDPENEDILVGGVSEAQLDHVISILKVNGVDVVVGVPQISYRETITNATVKDYTHKRLRHGEGEFARVILEISPMDRHSGFVFENRVKDEAVPTQFVADVEKGVRTALSSGPIVGMPVVDVKVALLDGAFHETDSSAIAFEIAARAGFREALKDAGLVLLEPIVRVSVATPEEYIGSVIGDLNSRRGQVIETSQTDAAQIVVALVPLANMFGYINSLGQLTRGRGKYSSAYSHYAIVPRRDEGPDLFPPAVGMRA